MNKNWKIEKDNNLKIEKIKKKIQNTFYFDIIKIK